MQINIFLYCNILNICKNLILIHFYILAFDLTENLKIKHNTFDINLDGFLVFLKKNLANELEKKVTQNFIRIFSLVKFNL